MVFKVIAHWKLQRCFNAIILLQNFVKFCLSVWSRFGLKTNNLFYFSLSQRRIPELNINPIERSRVLVLWTAKKSNTQKIQTYRNRRRVCAQVGRSRFGLFLQKKAVSAETNYGSFLFSLRPIHGQNIGEINFSTCFIGRRMKSTFKGIHSYASSVIRPNKKKKRCFSSGFL